MTAYYVDSGQSGISDESGTTPTNAWTSFAGVASHGTFSVNDVIYVAYDSVEINTSWAANLSITGPATTPPLRIISVDNIATTPTYRVATVNQIDTTNGTGQTYTVTFTGSVEVIGLQIKSGGNIATTAGIYSSVSFLSVTMSPAANAAVSFASSFSVRVKDCVIDLSADSSSSGAVLTGSGKLCEIRNMSFVSPGNRTGSIFNTGTSGGSISVSGCDFSGFTNATTCEILDTTDLTSDLTFAYCKTKASPTLMTSGTIRAGRAVFINTGNTDDPRQLVIKDRFGGMESNTTNVRTGGASIEDAGSVSWLVSATSSLCGIGSPFVSPWIYGAVASTGEKTFTCYIQNDTASLTDADIYLEVQVMGAADSPLWSSSWNRGSDYVAVSPSAHATDDSGVSWTSDLTYKQKLTISQTVGETGQFRARVFVAKTSATNIYIDPKISVA